MRQVRGDAKARRTFIFLVTKSTPAFCVDSTSTTREPSLSAAAFNAAINCVAVKGGEAVRDAKLGSIVFSPASRSSW